MTARLRIERFPTKPNGARAQRGSRSLVLDIPLESLGENPRPIIDALTSGLTPLHTISHGQQEVQGRLDPEDLRIRDEQVDRAHDLCREYSAKLHDARHRILELEEEAAELRATIKLAEIGRGVDDDDDGDPDRQQLLLFMLMQLMEAQGIQLPEGAQAALAMITGEE